MVVALRELESISAGDRSGFTRWGVKSGVEVFFRKNAATGLKDSIGVVVVDVPLEAAVAAVDEESNPEQAHDAQFKRVTVLETYDAEVLEGGVRCDLRRYEYKPVFPTMARDMLVFLGIVKRGGRVLRAVVSAPPSPLPGAAEDPKYVRMDVALAGFAFERVGAARTKIISVVAMDPAGSVPRAAVNFVAMDRPLGLARLRDSPFLADPSRWP